MKLSLNILKNFIDIPENLDIKKLAYDLTISTVEVEKVTDLSQQFQNIYIASINQIIPHPNADKLKICKVNIGYNETLDIVCGGNNLKEGMKVALAVEGALVRWHGEGEPVKIKKTKIRGIQSSGMICASSEIGLSGLFSDENGAIMDLSNFPDNPGTPLAKALNLNDFILEIDNKSLTNRPDLWGHYGIARELSAIYKIPLKNITSGTLIKNIPPLDIKISATQICQRYILMKYENLSAKSSPFELQLNLWKVGINPINTIVDLTNFTMIITGQPIHAFDADKINGNIHLNFADTNQKISLLNDQNIILQKNNLITSDDKKILALSGVMGGNAAVVDSNSKSIFIEIANFDALNIRHTSTTHNIHTDASRRYEKSIDPERCDIALNFISEMFKKIYNNAKITGFSDYFPSPTKKNTISFSIDWLHNRLGKIIPFTEISEILKFLGFSSSLEKNIITVTVPSWRSTGDISIPNDIVEEIARIHGLENFNPLPIQISFSNSINQPQINLERKIKEYLAFRCNMREIFSYPWVNIDFQLALFNSTDKMLSLSAPPSPNEKFLASSLLPNLCNAVLKNLRYFDEFNIFESGQVFLDSFHTINSEAKEILPIQKNNLAGAFVSKSIDYDTLFKKAKGIIQFLPKIVHTSKFSFTKETKPLWSDNIVWLNIFSEDNHIGDLGLLSKNCKFKLNLKNSTIMLFEINLDSIKALASRENTFAHYSDFPSVEYDISILFDENILWNDIQKILEKEKNSNNYFQSFHFVDEYNGKQIPDGKKSITIRLNIGSYDKTLNSNEIEKCANSVTSKLNKIFNAKLRS